jgi:prepilin-type processing-associated H-X9-DG protein
MNAQDLLDYTFGQLDEPRREQLDRQIAADPALADRVARLARAVDSLVDDGEEYEPPPGLARRTVALVVERRGRRTILDFVPARVPFRWADVAVAAGIFLAALATLLPAVQRSRVRADQAACAFNLQQLGTGLAQYSGAFGVFPYVPPGRAPAPYAGSFAILLNDAGYLSDPLHLKCPHHSHGRAPDPLPSFSALCAREQTAPGSSPCLREVDYGYNLGYRADGQFCPIRDCDDDSVPLLADQPGFIGAGAIRIRSGNSPNHGGSGQNILFAGGHVRWYPTRRVGPDDDIFLNRLRRPAPGLHQQDFVLAPGVARFDGE